MNQNGKTLKNLGGIIMSKISKTSSKDNGKRKIMNKDTSNNTKDLTIYVRKVNIEIIMTNFKR